jgi:hypothetical protein
MLLMLLKVLKTQTVSARRRHSLWPTWLQPGLLQLTGQPPQQCASVSCSHMYQLPDVLDAFSASESVSNPPSFTCYVRQDTIACLPLTAGHAWQTMKGQFSLLAVKDCRACKPIGGNGSSWCSWGILWSRIGIFVVCECSCRCTPCFLAEFDMSSVATQVVRDACLCKLT